MSGRWVYLYRARDKQGQLIDSMLSAKRDMVAAQRFFRSTQTVAGRRPTLVTTDGHNAYPRAIAEVFGEQVKHRCSRYKTIGLSKTTGALNSAMIPRSAFKAFDLPSDSVARSMSSVTTSGHDEK